ncbi:MAG TPA: serine hydrolase [Thermoanaerobaculia bacterium]|nr:serine hydrolase [Thermoanaerobaculia bacterium]
MRKLAVLLLATLVAPLGLRAADDPLEGFWLYATSADTGARGELTLKRDGSTWHASIAGIDVDFPVNDRNVAFAVPANRGKLRAQLSRDERTIDGYWLRPTGAVQAFASPLTLRRTSASTWKGDVRPMVDRFTLYLHIFRGQDGTLLAAFRNPEQHSHGPANQLRVTRDGNAVQFRSDDAVVNATFLQSPDRLHMRWDDLGREIDLVRRSPADVVAFFPRPPGAARYTYQRPPMLNDGWTTARASDVGIDEDAVRTVVRKVAESDPSIRRASLIHSFLVARHGKLAVEEYFFGYTRDIPHDMRSAGKTFAAVLMGTAKHRGIDIDPDTKIVDAMKSLAPFANNDERKSRVTLGQLMTHSAGLACDDNSDTSPGNEGTMQTQTAQPDWWKYTLDLPMAFEPGTHYAYCSANINLVGGAIAKSTATWLPEWFDRTLATPMQFGEWHWNLMPTDEGYLGGGAYLLPRDLLKIGQLFLDGGVWHGKRLIDTEWVTRSTSPHFHISPATTGLSPEDFSNSYGEGDDGFAWHLGTMKSGDQSYRTYAATGNGGQVLIVVPDLDMAVVFTGGNYMQGGIWGRWGGELVGTGLIPTMRR